MSTVAQSHTALCHSWQNIFIDHFQIMTSSYLFMFVWCLLCVFHFACCWGFVVVCVMCYKLWMHHSQPEQLWLNVIFYCYCYFVTGFGESQYYYPMRFFSYWCYAHCLSLVLRNLCVSWPKIMCFTYQVGTISRTSKTKEIINTGQALEEEVRKIKWLNLLESIWGRWWYYSYFLSERKAKIMKN